MLRNPWLKKSAVIHSESMVGQANALSVPISKENTVYNNGGQFSPGNPLPAQDAGANPWEFQFRAGRNNVITPRVEDSLLPFDILKGIAQNTDIISLCIQMMIDQIKGDKWDIVPNDQNDRTEYKKEIADVKNFFYKPDGVHVYNEWLGPWMYDSLYGDCACLFKRHTRGGKLCALEWVDGSRIKPLIDAYGRVPLPPYAAYQQVLYGMPHGSSSGNTLGFTLKDIDYRPYSRRSWTPYGYSPIERILMKANIIVRRDMYNLGYYTDGTTPDGGIYALDNANVTNEQLKQLISLFNDYMDKNIQNRNKLTLLPKGEYFNTKTRQMDIKEDEWLARIVAIAFGVNPQAFIMIMNRSTGQLQDQQQTDLGLTPRENFIAEWMTEIIHDELGYPQLKFQYVDEKNEDAKLSIERDTQFVQSGILKIDEVRSARGYAPATDMEGGIPPLFKLGNDVVVITKEWLEAKSKAQIKALEMGNAQAGNPSDTQNKISQLNDEENNDDTEKSALNELKQYENFSIKRLKKKTKREFVPKVLSEPFFKSISAKLEKVETEKDIKSIFSKAETEQKDIEAHASAIEDAFSDIKKKIKDNAEAMKGKNKRKKEEIVAALFSGIDFEDSIEPTIRKMLTDYASDAYDDAILDLNDMGADIDDRDDLIANAVEERIDTLLDELEETTKEKMYRAFLKGDSIDDAYLLSSDRASLIADTESHYMQNYMIASMAKESDLPSAVLVSDGTEYDDPCIDADGQIWSADYALKNVMQHPRCCRSFSFVTQKDIDDNGGVDKS